MIRETNVHILSRRELADWAESVRADVGVLPGPEMTASMIKTAIAHAEDAARLAKLVPGHYECDGDGFYACPKAETYIDAERGQTECVCGGDERIAALEAHRKLAEEA